MTPTQLHARRPYSSLTRLTVGALAISALAYASEFLLLGQIDREVSIVVGCLLVACALVASGWRWTPALGGLLAGAILLGNPFLLVNLSQPITSGFFAAAAIQLIAGLVALVTGISATLQSYRTKG